MAGAERSWADIVGVRVEKFARTTLKKHNPKTVRKNVGDGYRGCLSIDVRKSSGEYRMMNAAWRGIGQALERRAVSSL